MFKIISAHTIINESGDVISSISKCPVKKGDSLGIETNDELLQWFFDIYKNKTPELFQYLIHYVEYSSNANKMQQNDVSNFWHYASCYIDGEKFFNTEDEAKAAAKQYLSNREKREDNSVKDYSFSIRKYKVMSVKQFVQQVLLNKAYRAAYKSTTLMDIAQSKD